MEQCEEALAEDEEMVRADPGKHLYLCISGFGKHSPLTLRVDYHLKDACARGAPIQIRVP